MCHKYYIYVQYQALPFFISYLFLDIILFLLLLVLLLVATLLAEFTHSGTGIVHSHPFDPEFELYEQDASFEFNNPENGSLFEQPFPSKILNTAFPPHAISV